MFQIWNESRGEMVNLEPGLILSRGIPQIRMLPMVDAPNGARSLVAINTFITINI
jgi:hypothetical protein